MAAVATTDCGEDESEAGRSIREKECIAAEDWFGTLRLQSILSALYSVPESIVNQTFSTELSWTRHRYCTNWFFQRI